MILNYSNYAKQYLGAIEGDSKHKFIIDEYNKINPLPRGYKMTYSDAWCAAFVSFVLSKCNPKYNVYECGVQKMYNLCHSKGLTTNTPHVNDLIFYEWGDDPVLDHVGIITNVDSDSLTVIEGNKGHACQLRTINRRSEFIYGFATIPQLESSSNPTASALDLDKIASEVIRGKWGNEPDRSKKLHAEGLTDAQINVVQEKVNAFYNKEKKQSKMDPYVVAKDIVVNGNWGNGSERFNNLRKAGYTEKEIDLIQTYINEMLS